MIPRAEPTPAEILDAVTAILHTIETTPNKSICPKDGCLLIGAGPCPACDLRKPRKCGCGRRLNCQDAETCWVCLRHARLADRRVCGCGVVIRTDHEQCSRCRERLAVRRVCGCGVLILTDHEKCSRCRRKVPVRRAGGAGEWSGRWVRRGGIMRPVFEEVA